MSATASDTSVADHLALVPRWPQFTITGDKISARIPVTKLSSWRELPTALEHDFFNRPKTQLIFRGSRRFDWTLTPSLGRLDERRIITQEVAAAQLRLFQRAVRGRIEDRTLVDEEHELWSVGQHHGLHTPLLDWTYSPYVALFFAFEKEDPRHEESENAYRAIYVLNKSYVEGDDRCPEVSILEPRKDDHGRLVNQAGLFTFTGYGNTLENFLVSSLQEEVLKDEQEEDEARVLSQFICKIYVPNEHRTECLRQLRLMNVHHASLFPDLIGAASYCNILVADEAQTMREAEVTRQQALPEVAPAQATPVTVEQAPQGLLALVRAALAAPAESAQVEAPRLEVMAADLAAELTKNQYVDWDKRESIQASMRTAAKGVMRKYGYPPASRDAVIEQIMQGLLALRAADAVAPPN